MMPPLSADAVPFPVKISPEVKPYRHQLGSSFALDKYIPPSSPEDYDLAATHLTEFSGYVIVIPLVS